MRQLALHSIILAHHIFCIYFGCRFFDFQDSGDKYLLFAGRFPLRFATNWNFGIQCVYFVMSVREDLKRLTQAKGLQPIQGNGFGARSFLFTTIVFPISLGISILFWTVYIYNRELIFPVAIDRIVPHWFNHSIHTVVSVAAIAEMWSTLQPHPKRKSALICLNVFLTCYTVCVLVTKYESGLWAYPLLEVLSWSQRAIFFAIEQVLFTTLYVMGERFNSVYWDYDVQQDFQGKQQKLKLH